MLLAKQSSEIIFSGLYLHLVVRGNAEREGGKGVLSKFGVTRGLLGLSKSAVLICICWFDLLFNIYNVSLG